MRVIGTAGHVDHGKSALIEALTGIHPDRLKEEQDRQMTIDLGFGWLTLPDGQEVGIVDVPGHRDFIENMLAGIAGIDAVMLVVAVDEGVMPQTREHLAIVDLLQVETGVIVLTKTDLIPDREWLDAVEADVRAAINGTVLEGAPVVRVSARTGSGLEVLKSTLAEVLKKAPERPDLGKPRLPIDRVFTMSGFGAVVTGTLSDGSLAVGDEIQLLPSARTGRIRGLQTHRKKVERAAPGSRTAVNISGIPIEEMSRGNVLTHPGEYQTTRRIDARLRLLESASAPLTHHLEVKVFAGTSETTAVVRLLGTEELAPGQEGWIQLELHNPLVCARGDPFVLRRPSPGETIGGGRVVDPEPIGRHKRFDANVVASLEALAQGTPEDVFLEAATALGIAPLREIWARSHLSAIDPAEVIDNLVKRGQLIILEDGEPGADVDLLTATSAAWHALLERTVRTVSAYHAKWPLRIGQPREELKSRLDLSPRLFQAMVRQAVSDGALRHQSGVIALPGHVVAFTREQQSVVEKLMKLFEENPYGPPSVKDCETLAGAEIVAALVLSGQLVAVSAEFVFRSMDYDSMVHTIKGMLTDKGQITLAEVRDEFRTSRKYAQALLEHLDAVGVTRRSGDARVLAG